MKIYSIRLSDGYYKANNAGRLISFNSSPVEGGMPTQNQDVVQLKSSTAKENFEGKIPVKSPFLSFFEDLFSSHNVKDLDVTDIYLPF